MKREIKEIKETGLKGVTDLFSKHPYIDGIFSPIINISEEDFNKDPNVYHKYIDFENEKYINYLKEVGEYEKEYELSIVIQGDIIEEVYKQPLESYRMAFINFDEDNSNS